MNELPSTVHILDRTYKLKISPANEHFLRAAAELIDSQARNYGKMYSDKDRQDLLAMAALTQITRMLQQIDTQQKKEATAEEGLGRIEKMLASVC